MKKISKLLLSTLILFLSGCRYGADIVPRTKYINKINCFSQTKENITLNSKIFNSDDSKTYFDVDLNYYGYTPIYIKIKNKSNNTHILHPSYINVKPADPALIAKRLHYNTSLFVTAASCLSLIYYWPATIFVGQQGYNMAKYNKEKDHEIKSMAMQNDTITLLPYQTFETFIFVENTNLKNLFTLKVFNNDQKKAINFSMPISDLDTNL